MKGDVQMNTPLVVLFLGSASDMSWAEKIVVQLKEFQIQSQTRIASAHKTPQYALKLVKEYEKKYSSLIFIAIAGRSNALGGFLDANSSSPVINCPPPANSFAGLDILSSLRMPSGVAPATVLEADQAAILCAKIFAVEDRKLRDRIDVYHKHLVEKLITADRELEK